MERKKVLAIPITVMVIAVTLCLGLIYIHDNPSGLIPISSINTGTTEIGAKVIVKGNITAITVYTMNPNDLDVWISDGTGILEFFSTDSRFYIGMTVIVKGTVYTNYTLLPTSSVEIVILFS